MENSGEERLTLANKVYDRCDKHPLTNEQYIVLICADGEQEIYFGKDIYNIFKEMIVAIHTAEEGISGLDFFDKVSKLKWRPSKSYPFNDDELATMIDLLYGQGMADIFEDEILYHLAPHTNDCDYRPGNFDHFDHFDDGPG